MQISTSQSSCITIDDMKAYAAYCGDKQGTSSSGGVFAALAEYIISTGGIVYGAENCVRYVRHIGIQSIEQISRLQSSKYVCSRLENSFCEIEQQLRNGRTVLFSGTPCQVFGLQNYLKNKYSQLITVSVACHGVPSEKMYQKYIEYMEEKEGSELVAINFRDKRYGWKNYGVATQFRNGKMLYRDHWDDPWMRAFISGTTLRSACYSCVLKGERLPGDIVLADFWGIENILPEWNENKGVSLVITKTELGNSIFDKIKCKCQCCEVQYCEAVKKNKALLKPTEKPECTDQFVEDIQKERFDRVVYKYFPNTIKYMVAKYLRQIQRKINDV